MNISSWFIDLGEHEANLAAIKQDRGERYTENLNQILDELQECLKSYPDETEYIDVDVIIKIARTAAKINDGDLVDIVLQNMHFKPASSDVSSVDTQENTNIINMNKPIRRNDWLKIIMQAVKAYEEEYDQTPGVNKLWLILKENPPEEWEIEYIANGNFLTTPEIDKPLTLKAFKARYNRYYPKK